MGEVREHAAMHEHSLSAGRERGLSVGEGCQALTPLRWVPARGNGRFLFPVKALAKLVRRFVREAVLPARSSVATPTASASQTRAS